MRISVSKLKAFKACRRGYFFKYIENLEPVEKAEALQTGSNYHELLEIINKYGGLINDTVSVEEDYSKELAMAVAYEKYIYPKFKVTAAEEWMEKPVGKHLLVGRLDGIAEDGSIVEHKTTSQEIGEDYEFNLQWDEQILAYMYMTGARKVYYTVCRKPTIRQKKNETDEEFFARMVEWYEEDTDSKIRMMEIYRTDEEVEAFVKDLEEVCDIMDETQCYYRNTTHCTKWGRRCEYAPICLNYDPNQQYVEFVKKEDVSRGTTENF